MKRYRLKLSALKTAVNGAWVAKSRIVGVFPARVPRVRAVIRHLKSIDHLIDVTEKAESKSLILLDTGYGILSPFTPRTLGSSFEGAGASADDSKDDK